MIYHKLDIKMRIINTFIVAMMAMTSFALGVIDVHSHIITPEFVVRIAEIEVHPQYLDEYLAAAKEIQQQSLATELCRL